MMRAALGLGRMMLFGSLLAVGCTDTPRHDTVIESAPEQARTLMLAQQQADAVYDVTELPAPKDAAMAELGARNPGQALDVQFTAKGVSIESDDGHALTLRFSGLGREQALLEPEAIEPSAEKNLVRYAREGSEEWYVNGPLGIEQGFTLEKRPEGKGQLELETEVQGTLEPELTSSDAVALVDAKGVGHLVYGELYAWDAAGKTLPSELDVRGSRIVLRIDDSAAEYPVHIDPLIYVEGQIPSGETSGYLEYGASMALDGNTLVVGAPNYEGSGSVFVFERSGTRFTLVQRLFADDGATLGQFGDSVAIHGDRIVVGAPADSHGGGAFAGSAYVFRRVLGWWMQEQKLVHPAARPWGRFGRAVAIHGATIAVTASRHVEWAGATEPLSGVVVFKRRSVWEVEARLAGHPGGGKAVALLGDELAFHTGVVSSRQGRGEVRLFSRRQWGWSPTGVFFPSDGTGADDFGAALSLTREQLTVGAPGTTHSGASGAGAVHVYMRETEGGTRFRPAIRLIPGAPDEDMAFGYSVSFSRNVLVVGAPQARAYRGAVFVYSGGPSGRFGLNRTLRGPTLPDGEWFLGTSVVVDNTERPLRLYAGAPYVDTGRVIRWHTEIVGGL